MARARWYLVGYDVAHPRRLARIHRFLKSRGLWLQRSVFFVQATPEELARLVAEVSSLLLEAEDDLRLWPVARPANLWTTRPAQLEGELLHVSDPPGRGLITRIWRKLHAR